MNATATPTVKIYEPGTIIAQAIGAAGEAAKDEGGRFLVYVPTTIHIPARRDLPALVEGKASIIADGGKAVAVMFRAMLVGVRGMIADYTVATQTLYRQTA